MFKFTVLHFLAVIQTDILLQNWPRLGGIETVRRCKSSENRPEDTT